MNFMSRLARVGNRYSLVVGESMMMSGGVVRTGLAGAVHVAVGMLVIGENSVELEGGVVAIWMGVLTMPVAELILVGAG